MVPGLCYSLVMAIFRPPTDPFAVSFGLVPGSPEDRLFSRLTAIPRGRNVYLLTDGRYTESQPVDSDEIAKVYFGGHDNVITASEQALLTTAGYGAYIT